MSCEILHLTGVVREHEGIDATLDQRLHTSGSIDDHVDIVGIIAPFELTAAVSDTVVITGKCRQA